MTKNQEIMRNKIKALIERLRKEGFGDTPFRERDFKQVLRHTAKPYSISLIDYDDALDAVLKADGRVEEIIEVEQRIKLDYADGQIKFVDYEIRKIKLN